MTVERPPAGRVSGATPLFAYFGHHKAASSWLGDITRQLCTSAGLVYANVHSPRKFEGDLKAFVSRHRVDFLAYPNANLRYVSALDGFRAFHVVRDPRDIVVSSYFSHLHSHPTDDWPELVEHRRQLQAVDKDHGLYVVIDFLSDVMNDIGTWNYDDPRIVELKMEDVVRSPHELLGRAFAFLGLVDSGQSRFVRLTNAALASFNLRTSRRPFRVVPLPRSVLSDTLRRNDFALKANGRGPGIENVNSHYRKGTPGDWVNHFDAGHKGYFKERYGDLLVRLGYESGSDW
jgi:hypothetical protein